MTHHEFITKWKVYLPYHLVGEFELDFVGLDKVEPQPEPQPFNTIAEAYERGDRVRKKSWVSYCYVQKYNKTESIDETGQICGGNFTFDTSPEDWELFTEPDAETQEKIEGIERHIEKHAKPWVDGYPMPDQEPKFDQEIFSETHHKIIDGLGTILSSLGANSGIMSIFMSWGDTQDSISTLDILNDYIEKYVDNNQHRSFDQERFERVFCAVLVGDVYENAIKATEDTLAKLDAYYASKKGGGNE